MIVPAAIALGGVFYTQHKSFMALQASWDRDSKIRQEFWQKEQLSSALQDFVEATTLRIDKDEQALFSKETASDDEHKSSDAFIRATLQRLFFVAPQSLLTETFVLRNCWYECAPGVPAPHKYDLFTEELGIYTEHVRRVLLDEAPNDITTPHPQSCAGATFHRLEQIRKEVLESQAKAQA
jgi:hypothetical protein